MNAKFNPVKLVDVKDSKPYTTTLQIAIGLGLQHASVIKLVRTYRPDFADLSPIRFEIRKGEPLQHGGYAKATEYAVLDEQQATFLMTLMRNSPRVIEFKKALVKAFFETREFIRSQDLTYNNIHNKLSLQLNLEKADASLAGHILGSYRKKRDLLVTAITDVERLTQPYLFEKLD